MTTVAGFNILATIEKALIRRFAALATFDFAVDPEGAADA
tara:strand:+ start:144 stop:263 length:120 start_codon:yes stop_codon:yes gene_type:complete